MPGVVNVAAVCFLFYIIFAILCVNYFKGVLMSCQGDAFDALPEAVASFLESPVSWSAMSAEEQGWFGPLSNVSEPFSETILDGTGNFTSSTAAEYCVGITGGLWPDAAGCCSAWPSSAGEAPTGREVCLIVRAKGGIDCLAWPMSQRVSLRCDYDSNVLSLPKKWFLTSRGGKGESPVRRGHRTRGLVLLVHFYVARSTSPGVVVQMSWM